VDPTAIAVGITTTPVIATYLARLSLQRYRPTVTATVARRNGDLVLVLRGAAATT
jgi:hypothetical protein